MSPSQILCPYCGFDLQVMPQRKRKCPSCTQLICVKSTPQNRDKSLMTELQAIDAERQWTSHYERQNALEILQAFGLYEMHLDQECKKHSISCAAAVVSLLENVVLSTADPQSRKMAFYQLALAADKSNLPFHSHLHNAAECQLSIIRHSGIKKVKIHTAGPGNACPKCESQSGNVFLIEDALNDMPLPCPECTKTLNGNNPGFCRCLYVAVLDY